MSDNIHRFIFNNDGIRGELVKLTDSCQQMVINHNYPPLIASLLQQVAAINVLLATTLKFEGKISIQLQTPNSLKMLVVQTTHQLEYRGLARFEQAADYTSTSFNELVQNGQLSITIEPSKGKRYQGIVPLDAQELTECIEHYFKQSEQLETKIWLFNSHNQVVGLLLQALPDSFIKESFQHLSFLASTLNEKECLNTSSSTLLHRLFHQENIKHLSAETVKFNCNCSKNKMLNSISLLKESEVNKIIKTEGSLTVKCEFCLKQFNFNEFDIKSHNSLSANHTAH